MPLLCLIMVRFSCSVSFVSLLFFPSSLSPLFIHLTHQGNQVILTFVFVKCAYDSFYWAHKNKIKSHTMAIFVDKYNTSNYSDSYDLNWIWWFAREETMILTLWLRFYRIERQESIKCVSLSIYALSPIFNASYFYYLFFFSFIHSLSFF